MSRANMLHAGNFTNISSLPFSWLGPYRVPVLRLRDRVVPWWLRLFYYRYETPTRLGMRAGIGFAGAHLLTLLFQSFAEKIGLPLLFSLNVLHAGTFLATKWKFPLRRVLVPQGAMLYKQHEPASDIMLLVEGYGRLCINREGNRHTTVGLVAPGDLFGEEALAALPERASTFEAVLESHIDIVTREMFIKSLDEEETLLGSVAEHLAQRLLKQQQQIGRLTYGTVEQRLAWLLLELSQASQGTDGPHPVLYIHHKDLAAVLGVWRETISAVLTHWGKEGIILQQPGCLLLKDVSYLQKIL